MDSMLPIIPMSLLQRSPKSALGGMKDYAVIQSHGKDRAFVLDPQLGRILLESGMLQTLRAKRKGLIGNVLRELSKK